MHEAQNRHRKSSGLNNSGSIGLMVGGIALIAGTAWYLSNHRGKKGMRNSAVPVI